MPKVRRNPHDEPVEGTLDTIHSSLGWLTSVAKSAHPVPLVANEDAISLFHYQYQDMKDISFAGIIF